MVHLKTCVADAEGKSEVSVTIIEKVNNIFAILKLIYKSMLKILGKELLPYH
jgi:hypothetical protein